MSYLFPNQKKYSHLFKGKRKIEDMIFNFISNEQQFKKKYNFKLINDKSISLKEMGSNLVSIDLICFLIRLFKPKSILEIGSFIGRSSISFSKNSSKQSLIYTIEKFDRVFKILEKNIKLNKLEKKIIPLHGDAKTLLKTGILKKKYFDFVFIDGDKENYLNYLKLIEKKIKKGCIIIIDDIFFHGDVLNRKQQSLKGKGVMKIYSYLKKKNNYEKLIIPISNGIMIIRRIR
tara:strand:+ start:1283 stop:1978 length:696 start_codon:yes stop_codon:yes gene_type:complete